MCGCEAVVLFTGDVSKDCCADDGVIESSGDYRMKIWGSVDSNMVVTGEDLRWLLIMRERLLG
jgi:hypothetical protein